MKIPKEKTVRVPAILTNPNEVILPARRILHRVHTIHTAILIHPGETIPMMFIIMMIRMITGRRTTGNNASKLWRQPKVI